MKFNLDFIKAHVLGNDFLILDKAIIPENTMISDFTKKISDRKIGIGCDQIVLYSQTNDNCSMEILNQDGSKAEACGNATLCLASLMFKKMKSTYCTVNIAKRSLECFLKEKKVSVNMGEATFNAEWIPADDKLREICNLYSLNASEILCVDVGNPHLVIFNNNLSLEEKALIGEKLEKHPFFPNGVNVNFVTVKGKTLVLKVWERGVGFTLACGSGACASFAAAIKLGFSDNSTRVMFELGELSLEMIDKNIIMSGPINFVAQGQYFYEL